MTLAGHHIIVTMSNLVTLYSNGGQADRRDVRIPEVVRLTRHELERAAKACERYQKERQRVGDLQKEEHTKDGKGTQPGEGSTFVENWCPSPSPGCPHRYVCPFHLRGGMTAMFVLRTHTVLTFQLHNQLRVDVSRRLQSTAVVSNCKWNWKGRQEGSEKAGIKCAIFCFDT